MRINIYATDEVWKQKSDASRFVSLLAKASSAVVACSKEKGAVIDIQINALTLVCPADQFILEVGSPSLRSAEATSISIEIDHLEDLKDPFDDDLLCFIAVSLARHIFSESVATNINCWSKPYGRSEAGWCEGTSLDSHMAVGVVKYIAERGISNPEFMLRRLAQLRDEYHLSN